MLLDAELAAIYGVPTKAINQAEILKKLAQIDAALLKHDEALRIIWQELQQLLAPPAEPDKRRSASTSASRE